MIVEDITETGVDECDLHGSSSDHSEVHSNDSSATLGTLPGEFVGRRWRVFWMAFKFGIYTILTLGFYRFSMKTRLRRWYWSSVRFGGHPFEYVGDPLEKLLGFLIAVVILAFYICVVNLALMFASFSLFQGDFPAYLLSFLGVVPLWLFAAYRARRYVLARTRWRGIRFSLDPGAWGYVYRALWHWTLTLVSFGVLWPRKTFWLEKYKTDRTSFGSAPLEQHGCWRILFIPFLQVLIPAMCGVALIIWIGETGHFQGVEIGLSCILLFWFGFGVVHYQVQAKRRLTELKSIGEASLTINPSVTVVLRIYILGYGLSGITALIILVPISVIAFSTLDLVDVNLRLYPEISAVLSTWGLTVIGIASYFGLFLMWSALTHAFVTMPLWRHYASVCELRDTETFSVVTQLPRDAFQEAEGFAEALDVGAGI